MGGCKCVNLFQLSGVNNTVIFLWQTVGTCNLTLHVHVLLHVLSCDMHVHVHEMYYGSVLYVYNYIHVIKLLTCL